MDVVLLPTTLDKVPEKRSRLPWALKSKPLKSSSIFNKAKHSDEWHQSIDASAGVLHPSDPKFPWGFVRNHTDAYLQKKGKVNQADVDIRLSSLIDNHEAKDIAIAATAHALTPISLRNRLRLDLNVTHATYWGLKAWLQCLIAANHGNPASVTDLESLWARELLVFATHGHRAAEWLLVGMSRLLRLYPLRSMNDLPEFSILLARAIEDYAVQLEGYRLRNEWSTAFEAVRWMSELAKTSTSNRGSGFICPENVLDQRLSIWQIWATWQPSPESLIRLARLDISCTGFLADLLSLDGPDILTGTEKTLRDGLVARYTGNRTYLRFHSLVVHVHDRSRDTLTAHLDRVAIILDTLCVPKNRNIHFDSRIRLFRDLVCAQPITSESLDILEGLLETPVLPQIDVYAIVGNIYHRRDQLGGEDISGLLSFMGTIQEPGFGKLRTLLFQPWLSKGIERCHSDCRAAVRELMKKKLPWMDLSMELLAFCATLKTSRYNLGVSDEVLQSLTGLPTVEVMESLADILKAAKSDENVATTTNANASSATITKSTQSAPSHAQHPLVDIIEAFVTDRLIERGTIESASQRAITSILFIWNTGVSQRKLAILTTKATKDDIGLMNRCLAAISTTDNQETSGNFFSKLLDILCQAATHPSDATIDLTALLSEFAGWDTCWKDLLYMWLVQQCSLGEPDTENSILEFSLRQLKAAQWIVFMNDLDSIFAQSTDSTTEQRPAPPGLQPALLKWAKQLKPYAPTLTRLESAPNTESQAIACILKCKTWSKNLLSILGCLRHVEGLAAERLMQQVVGKLSHADLNHWDIYEVCVDLMHADQETINLCSKIWEAAYGRLNIPGLFDPKQESIDDTSKVVSSLVVPMAVVEVMLAGHLRDETITDRCKATLQSLAKVVQIEIHVDRVPYEKIDEATAFWQKIEQDIIDEADRLHRLQKALKAKDPTGTTLLLQELGIPDHSLIDEEISKLPTGIRDFVERVGDTEVEVSFPIASFTELRRNAMGISKEAKTLLVRISIGLNNDDKPASFCVHLDSDVFTEDHKHDLWICQRDKSAPSAHVCTSTQTAFVWQVNRILHMQLRDGDISLVELYTRVKKRLEIIGHACVACGASHNATNTHLRRGIPCNLIACAQLWYQLPLDVRIPEIRTDLFAVDAMLMAVYSAAMSNRSELLAGCPLRGSENIKAILNALPSLTVISHAVNISSVLQTYHRDAEKLISWAVVHHRGYIATATGICKVPTLTNVHQFVLANASPKLESDFVSKLPSPSSKSTVLFHGTTFDRLPAILSQGLKVCSGTALQRTGAAHGKGIYLAEDPATSLTYAPTTMSWKNSGLANTRLLLACEVAGSGRNVSSTIHVITDEKSVMVRYLFFLPVTVTAPLANHIVPAIASGMAALRKGVV